jgi:hypothetical protein
LRLWLKARGTKAVIPNRSNRKQPFCFDRKSYKQRHRIENAFYSITKSQQAVRNLVKAIEPGDVISRSILILEYQAACFVSLTY